LGELGAAAYVEKGTDLAKLADVIRSTAAPA